MKVSVVISMKNRTKLFKRSLKLWQKQTMPKQDFELIIIDDQSEEDVKTTLYECAKGMNVQYIKVDSKLNDFPIFWGPSLSNNVGFRASSGEVIVVTGPEILHEETNLDLLYEHAMKNVTVFGHVYHSDYNFVRKMDVQPSLENASFDQMLAMPGARKMDITHNTFYWFICAVKKEHIVNCGAIDENMIRGICGDDDLFAAVLNYAGITNVRNMNVRGIHQEHATEDRADPKRKRKSALWEVARKRNTEYLDNWGKNPTKVVNVGRNWGDDRIILEKIQLSTAK